jgi:hypothetical protein
MKLLILLTIVNSGEIKNSIYFYNEIWNKEIVFIGKKVFQQ